MLYFCDLLCMILHTVNLQSPRELRTYMYLFNFSGYQIILLVATYLYFDFKCRVHNIVFSNL